MSYKVCTRCQFVVPSKKKLCTTCGSKSFHVFEDAAETQPAPAAMDLAASVERSMIPAMSAVSISTANGTPLIPATSRTVTGLREKFSAVDEPLPANLLQEAWSKVAKTFLR